MSYFNLESDTDSQVYLKKWGYIDSNNHYKVTVIKIGEEFTKHLPIKSFSRKVNHYDIEDTIDERIPRIFEDLNKELEDSYNNVIKDLESNNCLSDDNYGLLLQIIPNFICRTDGWREWCKYMQTESDNAKINFLRSITAKFAFETGDASNYWETQPFYLKLLHSPVEDILNRTLILFMGHLLDFIVHFDIVLIEAQKDKWWGTSDNPVVVNEVPDGLRIIGKDSEFYFPLSPKYLAYLHFKGATNNNNPLTQLETNKVHPANDELHEKLMELNCENALEYVILEGDFSNRPNNSSGKN